MCALCQLTIEPVALILQISRALLSRLLDPGANVSERLTFRAEIQNRVGIEACHRGVVSSLVVREDVVDGRLLDHRLGREQIGGQCGARVLHLGREVVGDVGACGRIAKCRGDRLREAEIVLFEPSPECILQRAPFLQTSRERSRDVRQGVLRRRVVFCGELDLRQPE